MIDVTCAIIINDDNEILVTQRSEKMSLPLKWEFPGGKVKKDEDCESCIARELIEELNISIEILKRLKDYPYNYETFSINLIPFLVRHIGGQIELTEHKEAKWVAKDALPTLDWAEADIPIMKDIISLNYV